MLSILCYSGAVVSYTYASYAFAGSAQSNSLLVVTQALVIAMELLVFYTFSKLKHSAMAGGKDLPGPSDNMHAIQFSLSAVCRLGKLLLVWEILKEPIITATSIPLCILLREYLEFRG